MARKAGSHAEITGPAIREAALRLFARSGYAAVSMREIAEDVGVQAGALYLYTPDKQTLLFELMKEHLSALLAAWKRSDPGGDATARLAAFVRFHVAYHVGRRDAVFLSNMELRNLTDENFAEIEALRRDYEMVLQDILTDGQRDGVFHIGDVRVTTMALLAMLTGANFWFREEGRLGLEQVQTLYLRLVQRMVAQDD